MGILTPVPNVLGSVSLVAAVEFICAVHLASCVVVLSLVSSTSSGVIGGVEISPLFQCGTAAWFLLGIPLIIYGGVGAIYRVEQHLQVYMYYLVGTFAVVIAWAAIFARYGNTCSTLQPRPGQAAQASFVCGITNGMVLFWMLVLVGVVACSIYLVWSMSEYVKRRLETELIRYQEPWHMAAQLADDAATEAAMSREKRSNLPMSVPGGAAMPYGAAMAGPGAYGY